MSAYPQKRLRRLRKSPSLRKLHQETRLSISDFIYPMFVTHGRNLRREVEGMPGIHQLSLDRLMIEIEEVVEIGIPGVLLFGIPSKKNPVGSEAYKYNGIIQEAIRVIKQTSPDLMVVTDVCLCEFTDHGHCGVIKHDHIDNDQTLNLLAKIAVSHAEAGASMVAPSAMMDGQVLAIRTALDQAGHTDTPIMGYSAKYASSFFQPFRGAVESAPSFGDRKTYQMDPSNANEALLEIEQDVEEGADILMVKPALPYLDIISAAKKQFSRPVAAYNVSGEYAMVKAASANGWLDGPLVTLEILTAIKRAGADIIISYHAKEVANWLSKKDQ